MGNVILRGQQLEPGAEIRLYEIDLTPIAGGVLRYVSGNLGEQDVRWRGQIYRALPIEATGFDKVGRGQLPTPTLSVMREDIIAAAVITFDDLRRARVIRWRTFVEYLDGQPEADPNAAWKPDIFEIRRKVHHDAEKIEWQLGAAIDQQGHKIPGRVALRDHCPWIYRTWTGTGFDYSRVTCPYKGNLYFQQNGLQSGNPAFDQCGKRLDDCAKRFQNNPLPYGGFPGMLKG